MIQLEIKATSSTKFLVYEYYQQYVCVHWETKTSSFIDSTSLEQVNIYCMSSK